MSKIAEQRALEAYPPDTYYSYVYERRVDMNSQQRACFKEGYEAAKKDLGWISVKERLPEERKEYSDTLQGHREWTESDRAYGLLSRGCPRGCDFCIVADKEGRCSVKVADLSEFWVGQKKIVLCDPNILACREWKDLLQQCADSKAEIDFNQGLDIRLMTEEKIEMLDKIKIKRIHFAWDRYEDKDKVVPKLRLFAEKTTKRLSSHDAIVYTIVNFSTTIEQDLDRIYTLRDMGYWPYVMVYDKDHCNRTYKDLQRWVNNRFIFAKCKSFEEYLR